MNGPPLETLASILDDVSFFFAIKDAATRRYSFVNDAFCRLLERPREGILGRRDEELLDEQWAGEQRTREDRVLTADAPSEVEEIVLATPSRRHVVSLEITRSSGIDGPRLVLSGRDVTASKRRQEDMAEETELFRRVIDADPNLIFVKDRFGNFVLANQAMANGLGKTVDELVDQSNWKLHDRKDEMDAYAQVEREVMRTMREVAVEEDPFTHADGRTRWYRTRKLPLVRASGEVQVLAICTDITRLREAQQELARKADEAQREAQAKAQLVEELDQKLTLIEQQNREILSLSVPMLDVGGGILGAPIIGTVSTTRAAEIMDKLLRTIVERQARRVILDLTGLTSVDADAMDQLLRIVRAAELLGAEVVMTGISSAVARMIVELGLSEHRLRTMATLREALAAFNRKR